MGEQRLVVLVTEHDDTGELYELALEQADFTVRRCASVGEVPSVCCGSAPSAIVVHFTPRHDPAAAGVALRADNPRAVLIGLFSVQLQLTSLKRVLDTFDDVIIIPCSPDALLSRLVRLKERKQRQASA